MVGGRKVWLTVAGAAIGTLVTVALVELLGWSVEQATIVGGGIAGIFGLGSFSVAWEDRAKHAAGTAVAPPATKGGKP